MVNEEQLVQTNVECEQPQEESNSVSLTKQEEQASLNEIWADRLK